MSEEKDVKALIKSASVDKESGLKKIFVSLDECEDWEQRLKDNGAHIVEIEKLKYYNKILFF